MDLLPEPPDRLPYVHVDVFADIAYTGNSLPVFVDPPELTTRQLQRITNELRQFETIFVWRLGEDRVRARVFDLVEELDFAGHPLLGAAAVLQSLSDVPPGQSTSWQIELAASTVIAHTVVGEAGSIEARLDVDAPTFPGALPASEWPEVGGAVGLSVDELDSRYPPEVVAGGLRYLIIPVRGGALAHAKISRPDIDEYLSGLGAEYLYALDVDGMEGRHWTNDGLIEDVATGSAATCVAAYLLRHGRAGDQEQLQLHQGRFVGRPSVIIISAAGTPATVTGVSVGGTVALVGTGHLSTPPTPESC